MLGETRKPILFHPGSAQYGRRRKSKFPSVGGRELKRVFGPLREERLVLLTRNRPRPVVGPGLDGRRVEAFAAKTGLDPKELERLGLRHHEAVLRETRRRHDDAVRTSARADRSLKASAVAWANGQQVVATTGSGPVMRQVIDAPVLIWPTAGLSLDASSIAPENSFLKFHYQSSAHSDSQMGSFFFQWTNPSPYDTEISVDGYMIFSGTGSAISNGGWDLNGRMTILSVYGLLGVYGDWAPGPAFLGGDIAQALGLFAIPDKGLFYQHTASQTADVFRGYDLRADSIPVVANGQVTIELDAWLQFVATDGSVSADFSSGAFGVTADAVLVTKCF
jgi:hypothetical protein